MLSLFKRRDPICGMKEEKGKGSEKYGKWFCSDKCTKDYEKIIKSLSNKDNKKLIKRGCC
ncbi:MAG: hypothetical protein AB1571_00505 [Nanoarchaeota archaeon]